MYESRYDESNQQHEHRRVSGGFAVPACPSFSDDDDDDDEDSDDEGEEEDGALSPQLVAYFETLQRKGAFVVRVPATVDDENDDEGTEARAAEDRAFRYSLAPASDAEVLMRYYEAHRRENANALARKAAARADGSMLVATACARREARASAVAHREQVETLRTLVASEFRAVAAKMDEAEAAAAARNRVKEKEESDMIALMAVKDREEKEALRMRLEAETAQKRKEEEERERERQRALTAAAEEQRRGEVEAERQKQEEKQEEEQRRAKEKGDAEQKKAETIKQGAEAHASASAALAAADGGGATAATDTGVGDAAAGIVWSSGARTCAKKMLQEIVENRRASLPFAEDPAAKRERRLIGKDVQVHITQISATLEQVARKIHDICALFSTNPGIVKDESRYNYALSLFCSKLMAQCEFQVAKMPQFVYPLAEVTVGVCNRIPKLYGVLFGLLYERCILSIPKWYNKSARSAKNEQVVLYENELQWLTRIGYRPDDDGSVDEFVQKMMGYMSYYAAIVQSESYQSGSGLGDAWLWMARLLNTMPCNRYTASALYSFISVAGYRMHLVYGRQWLKLMGYITTHFIPTLCDTSDASLAACVSRLQTYVSQRQWLKEPKGRKMPRTDESSVTRA